MNKRRGQGPGQFRTNTIGDAAVSNRPSQTTYGGLNPQIQNYQDASLSGLGIISNNIAGLNQDLEDFTGEE